MSVSTTRVVVGVKKLSELEVDVTKDWSGKNIINLGAGGHDVNAMLSLLLSGALNQVLTGRGVGADPVWAVAPPPGAHELTHRDLGSDAIMGALNLAAIPNLPTSKVTSGRFGMPRMPDGAAGQVLIAQGAGSDPAWGDPIPKAEDESGSFSYTTGYGTSETDISALFTTPLTGTLRRRYSVWIDIYNMQQDAGAWTKLTVRVKVKIDGTNYRTADSKEVAKTDDPGVMVDVPAMAQDVQITFELDVALDANQTVYYHYVKEALE